MPGWTLQYMRYECCAHVDRFRIILSNTHLYLPFIQFPHTTKPTRLCRHIHVLRLSQCLVCRFCTRSLHTSLLYHACCGSDHSTLPYSVSILSPFSLKTVNTYAPVTHEPLKSDPILYLTELYPKLNLLVA